MSGQLAQKVRAKYPGAYDDLSDEQLEQAVTAKYPGVYDDLIEPPKAQTQTSPPIDHPHARTARVVGDVLKGGWNAVRSIPSAIHQTVTDPIGTAAGILTAPGELALQAADAFRRGDYGMGARKAVNSVIPIAGPMIDASQDTMAEGRIAEGAGEVAMNAALGLSGFGPRGTRVKPPRMQGPANAAEAEAVAFARREGVPLDLATATGNQRVRNIQKKVGNTWGGGAAADVMQAAQAENLARVGTELAGKAGPRATNPFTAGESVRAALTKQVEQLHQQASGSYDALRALEEAQRKGLPKNPEVLARMDITARTPLAVDISAALKGLEPLYQQLKRESELGIPMQGAKGRTLAALDGLMNGPSVASLSVVDGALSDLKAMARGADMPELRTVGQSTAAQAVQQLDTQVRAAAAKAGPNVLKTLEDGRAATRQKYAVADVLDMLSGEPGQVYRQLTQSKDVALERLKAVEKYAPAEMPNIARAYLEDMIQQATSEGGFAHADRLFANWQKLGPQTKARLFKGLVKELDNFFLLGKKIKENPNPSGTATIPRLNVAEAIAGFPAWVLSKMLFTPGGVRALTAARVASRTPSRASQALAVSQLTKAAQSAGIPLDAIPALAGEPETERPLGRPR